MSFHKIPRYWRRHDFVVVETIDFFREEENELPPPMALKEVVALNKAAPYEADEEEAEDGAQANGKPQDMQVHRPAALRLCLYTTVALGAGWQFSTC